MQEKMLIEDVFLIDGCRIPFLKSGTDYKDLTAYDLGRLAIKSLLEKTTLPKDKVDMVIMGNVVSNIRTSNVARESALGAGMSCRTPAVTVSMACISANKAITDGVNLIRLGEAGVVMAGGTESLSDIPIQFRKRFRQKLIESQRYKKSTDYLRFMRGLKWHDLLPEMPSISEFSTGRIMGEDCDRLAARYGVTRKEQDRYAARSHQAAAQATERGLLKDEVIPVRIPPDFETIDADNGIRGDSTVESLSRLGPAFVKPYGTLTAGNASFLTDGAAAVVLMSGKAMDMLGLQPRAKIRSYAYSGQDPREELLLGPAYATPLALDKAGLSLKDMDVFEFHEAFAAQVLANVKCLDSETFAQEQLGRSGKVGEVPEDRLNTCGGSLSIGHPFGATGARLLTTAANRLHREDGQFALIASCAAGAHGNAIIIERC